MLHMWLRVAHVDQDPLLQHGRISLLDAEHEIAKGTVDVLAAALHRRVVGRVAHVDRDGPGPLIVAREQRVQLLMPGKDHSGLGVLRRCDVSGATSGHSGRDRPALSAPNGGGF